MGEGRSNVPQRGTGYGWGFIRIKTWWDYWRSGFPHDGFPVTVLTPPAAVEPGAAAAAAAALLLPPPSIIY